MRTMDVYEELVKIKDPKLFEKRRQEILDDAIAECPKRIQQKLNQQQWCIDAEMSRFKDPIAKMNRMVEIFWKGVDDFIRVTSFDTEEINNKNNDCTIIPFKHK